MTAPGSFEALTREEIIRGIGDAVIQDNVFLKGMMDNNRIRKNCGGDGYNFEVRVREANIGGWADEDSLGSAVAINPYVKCTAAYRVAIWRLFENALQLDRNKYAPEAFKVADQGTEDLNAIKQEAHTRIGRSAYEDGATLFTGDKTGAIPMEGLDSIIDSTGTYFGVARATYPNLGAQEVSCVNPSLTDNPELGNNLIVKIEELLLACSGGLASTDGKIRPNVATAKSEPDVLITTRALYQTIRLSLNQQNQYVGDKQDSRKKIIYGKGELTYDTVCKASRLFAITWAHLEMRIVGPDLIRVIHRIPSSNPVGTLEVLAAQCQMHSKEPRYLGKIVTSGT